jgi:hypothetical protein
MEDRKGETIEYRLSVGTTRWGETMKSEEALEEKKVTDRTPGR